MKNKKLNLGCGNDKRAGWLNIDANKKCKPDVVAPAHKLSIFHNNTVDTIMALHLFEHLTYLQACKALREWHRVLRPGGLLWLELPDFDRCIEIIGKYKDPKGYDMGMIGLFGYPPMIETDGLFQSHKWAWSFSKLRDQLVRVGFHKIVKKSTTQKWRLAYKMGTNRDMRVNAIKK